MTPLMTAMVEGFPRIHEAMSHTVPEQQAAIWVEATAEIATDPAPKAEPALNPN